MWLTLARQSEEDGDGLASLPGRLEAVLQFAEELQGRLVDGGVDGLSGAVALHRRLTAVLDGISRAEIERCRADLARLAETLGEMAVRLTELRRLKSRLGG